MYVEHTGKAIGAGADDLKDLQEQMVILGLQPLISRPGNVTATGRAIDEGKSTSAIQSWIQSLEAALEEALKLAAEHMKLKTPKDFGIDIFSDFVISLKASEDIKNLIAMRKDKSITAKTFLEECKRRGLLVETLDVDEEIQALDDEGASLGLMGGEEEEETEETVTEDDDSESDITG